MSEKEAIRRALSGESISSLASEYGINRTKLQTMVSGVKQYVDVEQDTVEHVKLACDDCNDLNCDNCDNELGKKFNKQYNDGFDAGYDDAKKESKEEIEKLQKELTEAEETIKISADCQECSTKKELASALLKIAELQAEVEELKAFPKTTEKIVEVEKEKLAEMDRERAEMQAEIERLQGHKENLMAKCDRLAQELETAKAQEGSMKKEDVERLRSSLQSEVEKTERLESALSKLEVCVAGERAKNQPSRPYTWTIANWLWLAVYRRQSL
jgi:chromosome segregation ATPase